MEQIGLLGDYSDARRNGVERAVPDVHTVDPHCALVHVVQSRDEIADRGLSSAGRSHQGGQLARLDLETHIFECPRAAGLLIDHITLDVRQVARGGSQTDSFTALITERDLVELDLAEHGA